MITVSQMQGLSGVPGAIGEKGKRGERVSCDISSLHHFSPDFGIGTWYKLCGNTSSNIDAKVE